MPVPSPASEPAPEPGGWLLAGRYRVLDRIGAGGMAEVFRARDELLTREVAVKVFRRELDPADSAGGAQRQEIELQVLAQLSHPNLITLFDGRIADADGPDEHAYLVMELINGPSLAARLADGPLPEPEVRALAIQICHALSYVHGKGMVHRDVKPANILLGTDEIGDPGDPGQVDGAGQVVAPGAGLRARLSDFGIVRLLDGAHLTSADFMVGTASYLSPEQARGAEVGPPADIYAFGLVLLEALTGERTFPGPPMTAVLARLDGPPPIPDGLPEPWPGLLAAMTATDPAARPTAAQVAAILSADAAPVGLLPAADDTVQLAALPLAAVPLAADQTQALPSVVDEPVVRPVADSYRRGGGWLPWLLGALILITAVGVAWLIYQALQSGGSSSGPSAPASQHSTAAPTRTSRHSTASTPASTSQPATSTATTSAPPTSVASSTAPPTSTAPSSASTPASTAATSPASSTVAAGTSAAPASGGGSPTGSGTATP